MELEQAKNKTKKYEQQHLLNHYNSLDEEKKQKLLEQIQNIDFDQILNLYKNIDQKINVTQNKYEAIEYIDKEKLTIEQKEEYEKIGQEIINKGQLAVLTMAGGQGTRLGHKGPKGTFILDKENNKSLFEILCDTLKKANKKYNTIVPWYIMTSRENNTDTVNYFEQNNYFEYPKNMIKFFIQGELPMVDKNGKIIIGQDGLILEAADGHGGVFEAMFKNGVVKDLEQKNIKWVFFGPVDNPLVNMVDATLIGIAEKAKATVAGKSLVKASPEEKVGVFCKKNGKPSVIEYTEITKEMAQATTTNGELQYGESHMNCNMFSLEGIKQIGQNKLPYHQAFKKATYIDNNGNIITPDAPNAYKFESFIFDAFEKLDNMAILRVKREDEFAPVKNAEGVDSPQTALRLYKEFINRV